MDSIKESLSKLTLAEIKKIVRNHNLHYYIKLTNRKKSDLIEDLMKYMNDKFSDDFLVKGIEFYDSTKKDKNDIKEDEKTLQKYISDYNSDDDLNKRRKILYDMMVSFNKYNSLKDRGSYGKIAYFVLFKDDIENRNRSSLPMRNLNMVFEEIVGFLKKRITERKTDPNFKTIKQQYEQEDKEKEKRNKEIEDRIMANKDYQYIKQIENSIRNLNIKEQRKFLRELIKKYKEKIHGSYPTLPYTNNSTEFDIIKDRIFGKLYKSVL